MNTSEGEALRAFRQQVYRTFGCRRDALFELLDAVLTAPTLETPAHLSLAPSCRRGWGSVYDALNAGSMDLARLERLVAFSSFSPPAALTTWYAVDASVWPRCDAETSPNRGFYHHPYRHSHGQPIVAGWNYSWLVQLPAHCSSWTAPLRVRRITPGENINRVAAEQIRSWLGQALRATGSPPTTPPIFTFDAGYDPVQLSLALAGQPICLLIRLRAGRCFYADPTSQPLTGRPRRHGEKFVCDDPKTWPTPSASWTTTEPQHGRVCVQAWSGLHAAPQNHPTRGTRQPRPLVRGTLLRLEVERLPRPTKEPIPLWFWWSGPTPPELAELWQAYVARFSIEHTFRFFKQTLQWTRPKLRSPAAADRWTWLLILAYVQLRLARDTVSDVRLPWQTPLPTERRTPSRVRRGFSQVLAHLGSPVCAPKPCGRSPGRPTGKRSPPAPRFPAVKLTP
jgi:hypothetical protein